MPNDSQQRIPHSPIPPGRHPFLKEGGKPIVFLPRKDSAGANSAWEAVLDSSNFELDGRLGSVLRSSGFVHFMAPLYASEDACGRTTSEIWRWAAIRLGLYRWKNMAAADLDWFEGVLHELGFLSRYGSGEDRRWFFDGF
jgi:hypothetical protein